ncbi:hypothetical protein [Bacillus sp. CGMCC 1.16607]
MKKLSACILFLSLTFSGVQSHTQKVEIAEGKVVDPWVQQI